MHRIVATLSIVGLLNVSCSSIPRQSDVTDVEPADIINRIRCETKNAIARYPDRPLKRDGAEDDRYNPIIITYHFEFISEENNTLSAGATYSLPIHLGKFTIGLDAGRDQLRRGTDNITISESFTELRNLKCDDRAFPQARRYPVLGSLGVDRVVDTYFRLMPLATESQEFERLLFFKLKMNAGAHPSVSIVPVAGRKLDANVDLSGHRSDSHEVKITLASKKKTKKMTPEELVASKTVYVRFLDAFDSNGKIIRGPSVPKRSRPDERAARQKQQPALPPPPLGPPDADEIERAKEEAQREALESRDRRELRALRREILGE